MSVAPVKDDPRQALAKLCEAERVKLRFDVPATRYTTFALPGIFQSLMEVESSVQLSRLVRRLSSLGQSHRALGFGSNLLVPDEGVSDCVLKLGRSLRYTEALEPGRFRVGGATSLMTLSRELSDAGFSGLEFAGGIPASLGGAVRMNAGAHGGELSDVIESVTAVLPDGEVAVFQKGDLSFSYRSASLPAGAIVTELTVKLVESSAERTSKLRAEHLAARKATQPLTLPSAGSVFKNPIEQGVAAGKLLEEAGAKGHSIGGASVSKLHANWIVNAERTASARDIAQLIAYCQELVRERHGVELEPEIVRW